jgi:hypothetical protein
MTTDSSRRWIDAGGAFAIASLVIFLLASGAAAVPLTLEGLSDFTYVGDSSGSNATGNLSFDAGAHVDSVLNTTNPLLLALSAAEVTFTAALDPSTMPVVTSAPWPHTRDAVLTGTGPLPEIQFKIDGSVVLALEIEYIAVSQAIGATEQVLLASFDPASFGEPEGSVLRVAPSPLADQVGGVGTEAIFYVVFDSNPGFGGRNAGPPIWYDDFTSDASRADWSIKILFAPEPGSALLTGMGLLGLVAWSRRPRVHR